MEHSDLIYKYYSWDKYCKESLSNRYFWFSKPPNFNDPFDSNMAILSAFERSSRIFNNSFDDNETIGEYIKRNTDNFGILCFTTNTEFGRIVGSPKNSTF